VLSPPSIAPPYALRRFPVVVYVPFALLTASPPELKVLCGIFGFFCTSHFDGFEQPFSRSYVQPLCTGLSRIDHARRERASCSYDVLFTRGCNRHCDRAVSWLATGDGKYDVYGTAAVFFPPGTLIFASSLPTQQFGSHIRKCPLRDTPPRCVSSTASLYRLEPDADRLLTAFTCFAHLCVLDSLCCVRPPPPQASGDPQTGAPRTRQFFGR